MKDSTLEDRLLDFSSQELVERIVPLQRYDPYFPKEFGVTYYLYFSTPFDESTIIQYITVEFDDNKDINSVDEYIRSCIKSDMNRYKEKNSDVKIVYI